MSNKKRLLVCADWFYPGFKAGGPIQSLVNLVLVLNNSYEIFVVTSAYDLNAEKAYSEIEIDKWNNVFLPGSETLLHCWYAGKSKPGLYQWIEIFKKIKPDIIYLNGIFTPSFIFLPLLARRMTSIHSHIIISPRGMLQQGALSGKYIKKFFYLSLLRISGLLKVVNWHATDETEKKDISQVFGLKISIAVVPNIPKIPASKILSIDKIPGELRLVYLSLISSKKNLRQALELLREINIPLIFDIYGPIKDKDYWQGCVELIATMPAYIKIQYCNIVNPVCVQSVFAKYHLLFLPTKGENFGHAIYECFSSGRPVIIGDCTPWKQLENKKAGYDLALNNKNGILDAILSFYKMDQSTFDEWCQGAYFVSNEYWKRYNFFSLYKNLLG
ncbi:MAG: glycosyltransferase [Panacibacter sp.]